jgi:hypothetical protein
MSALGQKQTSREVRPHVRFTPKCGHRGTLLGWPLCAKSRHRAVAESCARLLSEPPGLIGILLDKERPRRLTSRGRSWSRLAHAVAPAGRREEMPEQSARGQMHIVIRVQTKKKASTKCRGQSLRLDSRS